MFNTRFFNLAIVVASAVSTASSKAIPSISASESDDFTSVYRGIASASASDFSFVHPTTIRSASEPDFTSGIISASVSKFPVGHPTIIRSASAPDFTSRAHSVSSNFKFGHGHATTVRSASAPDFTSIGGGDEIVVTKVVTLTFTVPIPGETRSAFVSDFTSSQSGTLTASEPESTSFAVSVSGSGSTFGAGTTLTASASDATSFSASFGEGATISADAPDFTVSVSSSAFGASSAQTLSADD